MSTDRRCGTCRHFSESDGYSGHCAIGAFLGRATAFSGESGCPGWSDGTDYARGWRDALAAAVGMAEMFNPRSDRCMSAVAEAIGELTPPGDFPNS